MARYYSCTNTCQGDRMLKEEEVYPSIEGGGTVARCDFCSSLATEELAGEAQPDDIEIDATRQFQSDECPRHSGYAKLYCPKCKGRNMDIDLYLPLDSPADFELLENGTRVGSMKLHGVEHRIVVVPAPEGEPGSIMHQGQSFLINIFATIRQGEDT